MSLSDGVRIGLSISLTGDLSLLGKQCFQGIRLAQAWINAHDGFTFGGRPPQPALIVHYDDGSRAARVRENISRLIDEDRVPILLGPYSSHLALAAAEVAEARGKLLWNYGGSSDDILSRGYRHLVSIGSPASDYLRDLPVWLARTSPALRRVLVLHSARGTFASHVARGFAEAAKSVGHHSTELSPFQHPPETDAVVRAIISCRPDVIILAASFPDEVSILRTRHLWPDTVRQVAAVGAGIRAFQEQLGDAAEGVIGPSQWEPGVREQVKIGPDSDWFVRHYRQQFGELPDYPAAAAFAICVVLYECIRIAGSLNDERLRRVAAELDTTTFFGRFRIDPATGRQTGHRIILVQWQDGRKVLLW